MRTITWRQIRPYQRNVDNRNGNTLGADYCEFEHVYIKRQSKIDGYLRSVERSTLESTYMLLHSGLNPPPSEGLFDWFCIKTCLDTIRPRHMLHKSLKDSCSLCFNHEGFDFSARHVPYPPSDFQLS
ncbi:unnamed protein product [Calicophoron daubneyi]|uniref:Uncharacterized protein n=1 Tax=Calicophoron daubneyi TaxID=300641 RepID=A0AAV2TA81_CALDB